MNFIHTIKFRFTLWYVAILALLLTMLGNSVYFTFSHVLHGNLDDMLKNRAEQLSRFRDIISIVASGTFEEEIGEKVSFYFYSDDRLICISHKELRTPLDPELIDEAIAGRDSFSTIELSPTDRLRIYIRPFKPDNPHIRPDRFFRPDNPYQRTEIHSAALVVGRPMKDIHAALEQLWRILLISGPLTVVLAGGGGVFLAGRAFKPVEEITNTARKIEESDLSRRIDVQTKDELGRLAAALNRMIERLERAFERQKQFTGDASHELRAPLAIIQAESTLAVQKERSPEEYQKSMGIIAQEAENMSSVINQLLTLARADSGKEQLKFENVDLSQFARDLCSDVEMLCSEKGFRLRLKLPSQLWVKGDVRSLRRLVHNLLSNAMRYTPRGGAIAVALRRKDDQAVLSVADTGIGIPPHELPLIFERFYRVDKARSRSEGGSGLGLAICRHIAAVHGGCIEVESQVGKGSIFHVKLPLSGES